MEKTGKRQVAECTVNAINRGGLDKQKTITVSFLLQYYQCDPQNFNGKPSSTLCIIITQLLAR